MVDIVNGLLVRNGQVLMARRCANRRLYPNTWSFPGGHVETGETLKQALQRELLEEIGIAPRSVMLLTRLYDRPQQDGTDVTFHLFIVEEWDKDPANLGDEHSELRWVQISLAAVLPDLAMASYRDVFTSLLVQ
ncbi:NUDIX domain-containing protein [Parasedimentitalea huanghaiensis]|uniref:8-oxo-dGTP diphosphatase n=1 Tax=Parasedimentitalea huanghaiensis TaxID=2682100 RepID=A0A6L6WG35_9RHOB|nr:NUDIX domain-containing protein [Zongyanglinia huanghaiensis]MVO16803.1 NUDIX domain-containing protein [Zongyanglinia huanghaiensis]